MAILTTTLIGLAAGVVGTGAGGLYVFFIKDVMMRRMSDILGFSGGIMLVAVFLELVPEALMISGLIYTMIGIIIGIIFLMVSEWLIESIRPHHDSIETYFARAGLVLFLAITCHNFPEGLAIGSGYAASNGLGIFLAIALAIHNIPEGLAVAAAFRLSGKTSMRAFIYASLAGIPMGLGALAGQALGEVSPVLITVSLGFAAGAMIYTTCEEILPDVFLVEQASPRGFILGLIVGTVFFNLI
ncbi:MAG: zinc transporter, family [Thermoanaerobacteraceae bacterium]|jgi:ZIP family zinc transporter|uniref:ZIP family metal transporter n=1 Tax=Biomaibacter acetigenes TaxID=2316383 RepID=A0A3G2R9X5_9FIRM|nr:ZIP family metal transporter [Biomaibacter acetigenes]AYO31828.1 ZIP family metal transporter [Biomaibacter acetigenes]MDK2879533.1 zinc transporter, family [Thermoanaerobacteraceae bacterium]MDN5312051.1 zinc transporter, family [Thermoanaerobacteraceae bacterium]RKL62508.1 ZIP family metal transporter [Thermoanaerobacteraceae bacterium SP2]